jgi:putative transposase
MHKSSGRPIPGYSYNNAGKKISDDQIKEWLCDSICGDGFPYGYKKLTICLRWEMDIKYGYIHGQNKFFFQLTLIDVFDRTAVDYYLELYFTAENACNTLKNSLKKRGLLGTKNLPKIRTDNGPQFIAHKFDELCDTLGIIHQRIPVKTKYECTCRIIPFNFGRRMLQ